MHTSGSNINLNVFEIGLKLIIRLETSISLKKSGKSLEVDEKEKSSPIAS
jgi:hypothetical protein